MEPMVVEAGKAKAAKSLKKSMKRVKGVTVTSRPSSAKRDTSPQLARYARRSAQATTLGWTGVRAAMGPRRSWRSADRAVICSMR